MEKNKVLECDFRWNLKTSFRFLFGPRYTGPEPTLQIMAWSFPSDLYLQCTKKLLHFSSTQQSQKNVCYQFRKLSWSHPNTLWYYRIYSWKFIYICGQGSGYCHADNYYMASFNFESLYTNIPLSETINICLTFIVIDRTDSFMNLSRLFLNIDGISYF